MFTWDYQPEEPTHFPDAGLIRPAVASNNAAGNQSAANRADDKGVGEEERSQSSALWLDTHLLRLRGL